MCTDDQERYQMKFDSTQNETIKQKFNWANSWYTSIKSVASIKSLTDKYLSHFFFIQCIPIGKTSTHCFNSLSVNCVLKIFLNGKSEFDFFSLQTKTHHFK